MTKYYVLLQYLKPNEWLKVDEIRTETINAKSLNSLKQILKKEYETIKEESIVQVRDASIEIYRDHFTKKSLPVATLSFKDTPEDAEKRLEKVVRDSLKRI